MRRTGGQLVVETLLRERVPRVFMVPGESFLPVLDALYEHRERIETVATRHESGAGFAAEGHAKATGQVGVCMATRGVGSANMAIALHTARQDSTPLVALVGQVPTTVRHREAFQEVDLVQTFGSITKWVVECPSAARLPELLQQAFRRARSGRPGPVLVGLPEDVCFASAEADLLPSLVPAPPRADERAIEASAQKLLTAEAPVVIAGGDVLATGASAELVALAERLTLPVVNAFRRFDAFPNDHPNFAGNLAPGMPPHALAALEEADLVLALGARLTEFTTGRYRYPLPGAELIQVAGDDGTVGEWGSPVLGIISSADAFLRDVLAHLGPPSTGSGGFGAVRAKARSERVHRHRQAWDELARSGLSTVDDAGTSIGEVLRILKRLLPSDAALVMDAGNFSMWVPRYFPFTRPGTSFGALAGAMGYALPAGIGVAASDPDRRVVTLAGDGGFAMTMSELATARQHGFDVLSIVFVNDSYGTIRMHQEKHYPGRPIATDLRNPSFQRIAQAHGIDARTACGGEEVERALVALLEQDGPALLEVQLGSERLAAWGDQR